MCSRSVGKVTFSAALFLNVQRRVHLTRREPFATIAVLWSMFVAFPNYFRRKPHSRAPHESVLEECRGRILYQGTVQEQGVVVHVLQTVLSHGRVLITKPILQPTPFCEGNCNTVTHLGRFLPTGSLISFVLVGISEVFALGFVCCSLLLSPEMMSMIDDQYKYADRPTLTCCGFIFLPYSVAVAEVFSKPAAGAQKSSKRSEGLAACMVSECIQFPAAIFLVCRVVMLLSECRDHLAKCIRAFKGKIQ